MSEKGALVILLSMEVAEHVLESLLQLLAVRVTEARFSRQLLYFCQLKTFHSLSNYSHYS